jgi:hypothetical protein
MSEQHYDIIGDVHGHADALRRLLLKLGYDTAEKANELTSPHIRTQPPGPALYRLK